MTMTIYTWIFWFYYAIVSYIVVFLFWNMFKFNDWKEELMSCFVLVTFVLRLLAIK